MQLSQTDCRELINEMFEMIKKINLEEFVHGVFSPKAFIVKNGVGIAIAMPWKDDDEKEFMMHRVNSMLKKDKPDVAVFTADVRFIKMKTTDELKGRVKDYPEHQEAMLIVGASDRYVKLSITPYTYAEDNQMIMQEEINDDDPSAFTYAKIFDGVFLSESDNQSIH